MSDILGCVSGPVTKASYLNLMPSFSCLKRPCLVKHVGDSLRVHMDTLLRASLGCGGSVRQAGYRSETCPVPFSAMPVHSPSATPVTPGSESDW